MKKFFVLLVLTMSLTLLMGCSGYGSTPSNAQTATQPVAGNTVAISNFSFLPNNLSVKVGTTVTWTNKDSTTHTVTSDSRVFNSGNMAPNATYSYTFATAGTFNYNCSIHSYMTGTVVVQ